MKPVVDGTSVVDDVEDSSVQVDTSLFVVVVSVVIVVGFVVVFTVAEVVEVDVVLVVVVWFKVMLARAKRSPDVHAP